VGLETELGSPLRAFYTRRMEIAAQVGSDVPLFLIGGTVLGLENDYKTLKKQDRDGFEQALMTAVATKLGGDACHSVQIVFHTIDAKEVCRVMVVPMHRPVYVKDGDTPKLYVRTGALTRELNVQEAIDYTSTRWSK